MQFVPCGMRTASVVNLTVFDNVRFPQPTRRHFTALRMTNCCAHYRSRLRHSLSPKNEWVLHVIFNGAGSSLGITIVREIDAEGAGGSLELLLYAI